MDAPWERQPSIFVPSSTPQTTVATAPPPGAPQPSQGDASPWEKQYVMKQNPNHQFRSSPSTRPTG